MSYQCDICHKNSMRGNLVSHSKQRTHRLYRPNLHVAKTLILGVQKSLRVCTKCLRTLKKNGSIKVFKPQILKVETKVGVTKPVVTQITEVKKEVQKEMPVKEMKVKTTTIEELMKESSTAKAKEDKPAKSKPEKKPKKKTAKSKK